MAQKKVVEIVEEIVETVVEEVNEPPKIDHIIIDCRVTTMDGKASSRRVKITNPAGCISLSQVNNSEGVFQTLFAGLVKKYGAGHIK